MSEAINVSKPKILGLYRSILREGRKFPIYNRRRYVEIKAKTDFKTYLEETDTEVIARQVQLAEDMLESLTVMGESQRAYFDWETDPISTTLVNGKPIRQQPPPRIPPPAPSEPTTPEPPADREPF